LLCHLVLREVFYPLTAMAGRTQLEPVVPRSPVAWSLLSVCICDRAGLLGAGSAGVEIKPVPVSLQWK